MLAINCHVSTNVLSVYEVPFNRPFQSGNEQAYLSKALETGTLAGDGPATQFVQGYCKKTFGFPHFWLTPSCTQALEMAAILTNAEPGDEIIIPSYTFVSTANAFVIRGAKPVFADSLPEHPNVDPEHIASLITDKTKAIVVVHYAGMGCDMTAINQLAERHHLLVIEDAAQCTFASYKGEYLGGIGHFGAISYHETKNIHCGEGGALIVRDEAFAGRAEIIREKGTNRSAFLRGEVDKYSWVDIGSSYLPSELNAAFLQAQLESAERVTERRKKLWSRYHEELKEVEKVGVERPTVPEGADHNGHIYYLTCRDGEQRNELIRRLAEAGIQATFHYQALHDSPYYRKHHNGGQLPNAERFTDTLVRLPLYYDLLEDEVGRVCETVKEILK